MAQLNEDAKALLRRPIYAWATTMAPDGTPHNTVVWMDIDDQGAFFNTAVGRAKERHLRNDPRVSLNVMDPDNPYHYVTISGTASLETAGAEETIDKLAKKYLNEDKYPMRRAGEVRVNVRVKPEKVIQMG